MAGANPAEALSFLHIPKSAGTTLNRLIEWEYPLFEIYSVDPFFSVGRGPASGVCLHGV